MFYACSCGFYQARKDDPSNCPRCRKAFLSFCVDCQLYSTEPPFGECRCGKRTSDPFESDTELGLDKLFETGESESPETAGPLPSPIVKLIARERRETAYGAYGFFVIPGGIQSLESARLSIHAGLEEALRQIRKIRDDVYQAQRSDIYGDDFLGPLESCFDQVVTQAKKLFDLFGDHAKTYAGFFEDCAISELLFIVNDWLRNDGNQRLQSQKIGISQYNAVASLALDPSPLQELAHQLATQVLNPLQPLMPLDRPLGGAPPGVLGPNSVLPHCPFEEIKPLILKHNPGWSDCLRLISTFPGLRYLNGLCQLASSLKKDRWRRCFTTLLDWDTYGLTLPGLFKTKEITDLGINTLVAETVRRKLADLGGEWARDFWCTLGLLETIVDEFGDVRLRYLSSQARGNFIVQRTIQSGDTNGVAFCLVSFPDWSLVYLTPPEGRAAAESALKFYRSLGIAKSRLRISIVAGIGGDCDFETLAGALGPYTSREIDCVRYPGGVNSFYQQFVNLNYIQNASELAYIDAVYSLKTCAYKPVGHSTDIIYRYVTENQGDDYIAGCIHRALAENVSPEAKKSIEEFVDFFEKASYARYTVRAPLSEIVTLSSTKNGMIDLIPGKGAARRPSLFHPLILLFWVRGPQGDEAKEMVYRKDSGMFGMVPQGGKPWHHCTMQLLVTIRCLCQELSETLGRPVFFVPVGDVPEEAYRKIRFFPCNKVAAVSASVGNPDSSDSGSQEQGVSLRMECFLPRYANDADLVEFFKRLPAFQNRNRFNQLYLFYELFRREKLRVIQLGLRSGAIEQGMYLGIPTVYIDIDTGSIQTIRKGEPDTTERMLKMTVRDRCFPFFRCLFSKNVIGVYNRIVSTEQVLDIARFVRLSIKYPQADAAIWTKFVTGPATVPDEEHDLEKDDTLLPPLSEKDVVTVVAESKKRKLRKIWERTHFWDGTLQPAEVHGLFHLLKDLYLGYEGHWQRIMAAAKISGPPQEKPGKPGQDSPDSKDSKDRKGDSNSNSSSKPPQGESKDSKSGGEGQAQPFSPSNPDWRRILRESGLQAGDQVRFLYCIHRSDPGRNTFCTATVLSVAGKPPSGWPKELVTSANGEPAVFLQATNWGEKQVCVFVRCTAQKGGDEGDPNVVGCLFGPMIVRLDKA